MSLPRRRAFARDGFAVLDRFLEQGEVAQLQNDVESLVLAGRDGGCTRPHNTLLPLRWNDRAVELILDSQRRNKTLCDVVGADDLRWISGYISIKEARSAALSWHQDWWCWDHPVTYRRPAPQIAVLCYLGATDTGHGAIRVLPGSHMRSTPLHGVLPEAHAKPSVGLEPDHLAMSDDPRQVTLRARPGDAVVLDYRLLHGTHENASEARRDCILLSFTPSWRGLPRDVRAHLISHPAQPTDDESPPVSVWRAGILPSYRGARRSLQLNRMPPSAFEIAN